MTLSRRGFLSGALAALAAPAIVRPDSLMKLWVSPPPAVLSLSGGLLSVEAITREAIRMFTNSNIFVARIVAEAQYDDVFAQRHSALATQMRVQQ